jgi:4-hydroxy-3-methylbut-2-enyl diphosphate reductase
MLQGAQSIGICGATSTPKWLMESIAQALDKRLNNK